MYRAHMLRSLASSLPQPEPFDALPSAFCRKKYHGTLPKRHEPSSHCTWL